VWVAALVLTITGGLAQLIGLGLGFQDFRNARTAARKVISVRGEPIDRLSYEVNEDVRGADLAQAAANQAALKSCFGDYLREGVRRRLVAAWLVFGGLLLLVIGSVLALTK
jgi:hypothetical protein